MKNKMSYRSFSWSICPGAQRVHGEDTKGYKDVIV